VVETYVFVSCDISFFVGLEISWLNSVVLNLFFTTPPLSTCPLFQVPGYNQVIKANVLFGKFIYQIFNVVQRLRARAPPRNLLTPPGGRSPG